MTENDNDKLYDWRQKALNLALANSKLSEELERLRADAERYRFLRNADNWPEGTDDWDALMEASGPDFDQILDQVIKEQTE